MSKRLRLLFGVLLLLLIAALPGLAHAQTATPSGMAYVLVGNFSPNSPAVNIDINGVRMGSNLSFAQGNFPQQVRAGSIFIEVFNATTGAKIIDGYKDVGANDYYMVPVMNIQERVQLGAYRIPVYEPLTTTQTRVQFFHAVPQGPRLDVLNKTTNTKLIDAIGYVEDPRTVDKLAAGTYNWQVWTNNKTLFPGFITDPNAAPDRLVIDMGQLVLSPQVVYSFFIIGSPSGSPAVMALVLAMPLGGGRPLSPPTGPFYATPTPGPSPTPTRTLTPGPATLTPTPSRTPTATATPVPSVGLISSTFSFPENGGSITITVNLSRASSQQVTVNYATSNLTASSATDYTARSGTLTWAAGTSGARTFTVPIVNDTLVEGNETFRVTLSGVTGGATLGTSVATVTINDNDVVVTPTVTIAANPGPATVAEPSGTSTLRVSISSAPSANVTVNLTGTGSSATLNDDYGLSLASVTFTPSGALFQNVTLTVNDDFVAEGTETANVGLALASGTANVGGPVAITINDNDAGPVLPTVNITATPGPASISEANASSQLTVSISAAPTGADVTVDLVDSGTATLNTDYTLSATTVTFTSAGPTSQTVTLTSSEDTDVEGNETAIITPSITSANANAGTAATVTITDNEVAPVFTISTSDMTPNEGDTVTVTVTISANPTVAATVDVQVDPASTMANDGSDYTTSVALPTTLTFDPGGGLTQSFTITFDIFFPGNGEPAETLVIDLANPTSATIGGTGSVTHTTPAE